MKLSASEAEYFLGELVNLGYIEQARPIFGENIAAYEVTQQGQGISECFRLETNFAGDSRPRSPGVHGASSDYQCES